MAGKPPVRPPSPAPTPTFSLAAGSYNSAQTVTISDQTTGATIYYATNGTTPNANSSIYSAPIPVPTTETVEAVAVATGNAVSAIASATYTINLPPAATPTFSVPAGTYLSAQTVTIRDTTAGATIYYTTNGTTPTTSSTVYSGAITVSASETIEAIAVASRTCKQQCCFGNLHHQSAGDILRSVSTPSSLTVNSGSSGSVTLTVTPQNGFSSTVNFGCTGLPGGATCSFSPTTVAPSGGAVTTQVTILAGAQAAIERRDSRPFLPAVVLGIAVCFAGLKKRRRGCQVLLLVGAFAALGLISACGGGGGTGGGGWGRDACHIDGDCGCGVRLNSTDYNHFAHGELKPAASDGVASSTDGVFFAPEERLDYGGFTATRLMMRWTKTTCVWMWLAIDGTNSVMKLSMGAVAKPMP